MAFVYQLSPENVQILARMAAFVKELEKSPLKSVITRLNDDLKLLEEAMYYEDAQRSLKGKDRITAEQRSIITEVDSIKHNIVKMVDEFEQNTSNNSNSFLGKLNEFQRKYNIEKQRLVAFLNKQKNANMQEFNTSANDTKKTATDTVSVEKEAIKIPEVNKKAAPKPKIGLGSYFLSSLKAFFASLSDQSPAGEQNRLKAHYGIMGVALNLITTFVGGLFKMFMGPAHEKDIDDLMQDAPTQILKGMGVSDDMIPHIKVEVEKTAPTQKNANVTESKNTVEIGSFSKSKTYTPALNRHNNNNNYASTSNSNNNNNYAPMPSFANSILHKATETARKRFFNQYVPGIVSGPAKFLYNTFVGGNNPPAVKPQDAWKAHFTKK